MKTIAAAISRRLVATRAAPSFFHVRGVGRAFAVGSGTDHVEGATNIDSTFLESSRSTRGYSTASKNKFADKQERASAVAELEGWSEVG